MRILALEAEGVFWFAARRGRVTIHYSQNRPCAKVRHVAVRGMVVTRPFAATRSGIKIV